MLFSGREEMRLIFAASSSSSFNQRYAGEEASGGGGEEKEEEGGEYQSLPFSFSSPPAAPSVYCSVTCLSMLHARSTGACTSIPNKDRKNFGFHYDAAYSGKTAYRLIAC